MPTVTLDRKTVEKLIGKKMSSKELKDRISMLGTDLEELGKEEITVEIFPNRPDMLSEQGFARALSSFVGQKTGLKKYKVKSSGEKVIVKGVKDVRPYTVCAIIKDLDLDDEKVREIIQVQEKLHVTFCRRRKKAAIGIYPLENIKTPIYFKAKKPKDIVFVPLDGKKMDASRILEEHPTGKKYAHLVEDLKRYAVFEDSEGSILSFTPIINSEHAGRIKTSTKEAFVEVSGFDLNTLRDVLNILVTAFADMGATIYSMEVEYDNETITTPDLSPLEMEVDISYINRLLGLELKKKEFKELLERMGFGYNGKVLVPAYRADILHQADIAEDVAIAYGYENFGSSIPMKGTAGGKEGKKRDVITDILVGLGLLEVSSYHLTGKHIYEKAGLKGDFVKLANSVSAEHDLLRHWLLPGLLEILGRNTHNEYPQKIFEIGKIFRKGKSDTGVVEPNSLAVALAGESDYTAIRQVLDYLMKQLGREYEIKESEHPLFVKGRSAKIISGKTVGYLGEVHPKILEKFDIEMPLAALEIHPI